MRDEKGKSWWIGRALWLGGAVVAAVGGWFLLKDPHIWLTVGGVAAMGVGNYIRHDRTFDD